MSVLVQVEVEVKPERLEALKAMLKQGFPHTREFAGCQAITAYLNEDGKTMVVVEHWDSKAHYQRYYDWREQSGALEQLASCFQTPANIRYFDAIDA